MITSTQFETLCAIRAPRSGTPLEIGRQREAELAAALLVVAQAHGVQLRSPLQIDARGEFNIVAMPLGDESGWKSPNECGHFSNGFHDLLNQHNPRCGMFPTATLDPENGWCMLNHFDAERLVLAYCNRLEEEQQQMPPDAAAPSD